MNKSRTTNILNTHTTTEAQFTLEILVHPFSQTILEAVIPKGNSSFSELAAQTNLGEILLRVHLDGLCRVGILQLDATTYRYWLDRQQLVRIQSLAQQLACFVED